MGMVALCAALGSCVTAETVSFRASNPQQQAMMRTGSLLSFPVKKAR
jgi:hypothetical protein